jgi:hypothetical protein
MKRDKLMLLLLNVIFCFVGKMSECMATPRKESLTWHKVD